MNSEAVAQVGPNDAQLNAPSQKVVPADDTQPEKPTKLRQCGCFDPGKITWPCVKGFLLRNYLVIGLITAIIFSLAIPWPGRELDKLKVGSFKIFQTIFIVIIFIVSGLGLRTEEIKNALRNWFAFIVGSVSILFITPCAAFVLVLLPFEPPAYSYGLSIFALVPTTIASGITLVNAGKGNGALALMLTVVTNLVAVFIIPYSIKLIIKEGEVNVEFNPVDLLVKLVMTILVPLLIGKFIREVSPWVRRQVTKHKLALSLISNTSLILIVWLALSSAQSYVIHTGFGVLCLMVLAAILLHVAYLIVNFIIVKIMRLNDPEATAVLIMASEKTLPMAVTVISFIPESIGTAGLLTVPCVIAHISQVLMDAALADRLGRRADAKAAKAKEVLPQVGEGAREINDEDHGDDGDDSTSASQK